MMRLKLLVGIALIAVGCGKSTADSGAVTARADPALLVPTKVPFVRCPITIPADSEVVDAKSTSFTIKVKGGRPLLDPNIMVVNSIVNVFSKDIDSEATNLTFTTEEQRPDGYALEGEFQKQGRRYYFVDRSIPCAHEAWLACRIVTIDQKNAAYASRVCRTLVPAK